MSEDHSRTTDTQFAVLRALDAYDRIGVQGVFNRLTTGRRDESGAVTPGVGVTNGQALVLCGFLDRKVQSRLDLIEMLDESVGGDGRTAWDDLLDMPANEDETWANGGRPRNIALVLDDIAEHIASKTRGPA